MAESGDDSTSREIRELIIENTSGTGAQGPSPPAESTRDSKYRKRRTVGRRITLQNRNGEYKILRGGNVIQSFCLSDFERVTCFVLPEMVQQEVRIEVVSLSPPCEISIPQDEEAPVEDGVELRTITHPVPERLRGLRPETLEEMEVELPDVERALNSWQEEAIDSIRQDIERLHEAMAVIANLGGSR